MPLRTANKPRLMSTRITTKIQPVEPRSVSYPHSCFSDFWLIFRQVNGPKLRQTALVGLSKVIRKILLKFSPMPIPEAISGHQPDGSTSDRTHLAAVPLPFVASSRANGNLLGFALVPPRDLSASEWTSLLRTLENWQDDNRCRDKHQETLDLPINLGNVGVWKVRKLSTGPAPRTLSQEAWCRPSRMWLSSSPVALDRNPGDLTTRNHAKSSRTIDEARKSLRDSILRLGLPTPVQIELLPYAPLSGSAMARAFCPFPSEPGRTRRVLTHAMIRFEQPVIGPILVGAGRYLGLGLFWPQPEESM